MDLKTLIRNAMAERVRRKGMENVQVRYIDLDAFAEEILEAIEDEIHDRMNEAVQLAQEAQL